MKYLLAYIFAFSSITCFAQTSIYSQQVIGANAQLYPVSTYQGQKIMVVILPSTQTSSDTAFLLRVDSIALAYTGSVKTIAVPSYEDGYVADSLNTLMQWYQSSLDTSIIISQPLYTHVASGAQQDSMFSWLTHSSQNIQFDYEITGTQTLFFVDGQGALYGIFGPEAAFSNKALNRVLP